MSDLPDYYIPIGIMPTVTVIVGTWNAGTITITGSVTVSSIPSITIGTWNAGTLTISGTVNINTMPNITIGTWSAGTLTISGSVTVSSIPNVTIETWKAGTLSIDGSVTVTSIPSVTIGTWSPTAGTVTISGSVTVTSIPNVTIGTWSAGTLTISGSVTVSSMPSVTIGTWSATAGTVTITGSVTVSSMPSVTIGTWSAGTLTVDGTININTMPSVTIGTWSAGTLTISGSVSVTSIPTITIGTWSAGTLNVSVTTSVALTIGTWSAGTLNVDITAQTVGNLNVNIVNASLTVTGSVTITSGAVTVSTSGGTNIVLDTLTQGAYTERRSTLSNNGAAASWDYEPANWRHSKFFPRGARGFLETVDIYCKDAGVAGGTITVYVAPYVGAGYIASATITVSAGGAEAWRSATFNRMWNYDSLFIWWYGSTADMNHGLNDTAPLDGFLSTDAGLTWVLNPYRRWARAVMGAQTVGDIPVSGTVNTVEIPSLASTRQEQILTVPIESELLDTAQYGSGELLIILFYTSGTGVDYLRPRLKLDGVQVLPLDTIFKNWHDYYIGTEGAGTGIHLSKWDATGGVYAIMVTVPYPFKRSLEAGFYNQDTVDSQIGKVAYSYKKIG